MTKTENAIPLALEGPPVDPAHMRANPVVFEHASGAVESAYSFEEARKLCTKGLGQMSVKSAEALWNLAGGTIPEQAEKSIPEETNVAETTATETARSPDDKQNVQKPVVDQPKIEKPASAQVLKRETQNVPKDFYALQELQTRTLTDKLDEVTAAPFANEPSEKVKPEAFRKAEIKPLKKEVRSREDSSVLKIDHSPVPDDGREDNQKKTRSEDQAPQHSSSDISSTKAFRKTHENSILNTEQTELPTTTVTEEISTPELGTMDPELELPDKAQELSYGTDLDTADAEDLSPAQATIEADTPQEILDGSEISGTDQELNERFYDPEVINTYYELILLDMADSDPKESDIEPALLTYEAPATESTYERIEEISDIREVLTPTAASSEVESLDLSSEEPNTSPLGETFVKLAALLKEKPEELTDDAEIELSEVLSDLHEMLQVQNSSEIPAKITPEITEKLLKLLEILGYENPNETLISFDKEYKLPFLFRVVEYLCRLNNENEKKEILVDSSAPSAFSDIGTTEIYRALFLLVRNSLAEAF